MSHDSGTSSAGRSVGSSIMRWPPQAISAAGSALAAEQVVDDHAGDAQDGQRGEAQEADEEEFESDEHTRQSNQAEAAIAPRIAPVTPRMTKLPVSVTASRSTKPSLRCVAS